MTSVAVNNYTHSVTYVSDNILKSLKDIIRDSGLNPSNLVNSWDSKMLALETWLASEDLLEVRLEIYNPTTDKLIKRWDLTVDYDYNGDGSFYTDTDQIQYSIRKAGLAPSSAKYSIILFVKKGAIDVPGWSDAENRSTDHLVKQTLGSTINHSGLGTTTRYWRER